MKLLMGVWVGVVLTSACGSSDPEGMLDAGIDASPDAAVTLRTVTGTFNVRHVTAAGEVVVPVNISAAKVFALVPPAFTIYPGVTNADGTFSIPGVPEGTYYLQLGPRFLVMSADSVDLSFDLLGRPGAGFATIPTTLTFDVANLASWQPTDEIQMISPETGTIAFAMQGDVTAGAPADGATNLTGFAFDLSHASDRALIDGTAGDRLMLTQMVTQTSGTRTFRTVERSFMPEPFSVTNGGSANLAGTFSTVPPAATLETVWDRPAFASELAAHSPLSTLYNYSTLAVSALPEAATRGFYDEAADVLTFAPGYTTDSSAVTASWAYGDPYPSEWTRLIWNRYNTYRFIQLGDASPVAIFASLTVTRDLSTVSMQSPIVPIVGAVVNPKVNGSDAFGTLTSIGTTPTLSWSPPTIGVASRYYVTAIRVAAQNGATVLQNVALIETSATEVVFPSGILRAGDSYVFEIGARSAANLDLSATPNAWSLPNAWASVTSAMASP